MASIAPRETSRSFWTMVREVDWASVVAAVWFLISLAVLYLLWTRWA